MSQGEYPFLVTDGAMTWALSTLYLYLHALPPLPHFSKQLLPRAGLKWPPRQPREAPVLGILPGGQ